jgi:CheY-like chemotaxis protein
MNTPQPPASPPLPACILCVDDEPSILSALKRVFRPQGYTAPIAGSGRGEMPNNEVR